jgi:hypothetical protein
MSAIQSLDETKLKLTISLKALPANPHISEQQ